MEVKFFDGSQIQSGVRQGSTLFCCPFINGENFEDADQFAYLGKFGFADGGVELDGMRNINAARYAFTILYKICKRWYFSTSMKFRLFCSPCCYIETNRLFRCLLN